MQEHQPEIIPITRFHHFSEVSALIGLPGDFVQQHGFPHAAQTEHHEGFRVPTTLSTLQGGDGLLHDLGSSSQFRRTDAGPRVEGIALFVHRIPILGSHSKL